MANANARRTALLGINFSTAMSALRKQIIFHLVKQVAQDTCFQCGQKIENVDDLSIEHKESWQSADDPKAAFFDLENIAFSHLACNTKAGDIERQAGLKRYWQSTTECPQGHEYTTDNTIVNNGSRQCRECGRKYSQRWKQARVAQRTEHRSSKPSVGGSNPSASARRVGRVV